MGSCNHAVIRLGEFQKDFSPNTTSKVHPCWFLFLAPGFSLRWVGSGPLALVLCQYSGLSIRLQGTALFLTLLQGHQMNVMAEEKQRPAADQSFLPCSPPLLLAWRGLPLSVPSDSHKDWQREVSGATLHLSAPRGLSLSII